MPFCRGLLLIMAALCLHGCGPEELPFTDNSQDAELYAQNMRRTVLMLVQYARGGDPETQMGILATELSHTDRPVGDYAAIYDDMREKTGEALEICRASQSSKPAIDAQLDELTRLAENLPQTPGAGSVPPQ